jgi:hypothetical protein
MPGIRPAATATASHLTGCFSNAFVSSIVELVRKPFARLLNWCLPAIPQGIVFLALEMQHRYEAVN